jgi:hypothetical protein
VGHATLVRLLLLAGADVHARDAAGRTPEDGAASPAIVALLRTPIPAPALAPSSSPPPPPLLRADADASTSEPDRKRARTDDDGRGGPPEATPGGRLKGHARRQGLSPSAPRPSVPVQVCLYCLCACLCAYVVVVAWEAADGWVVCQCGRWRGSC